MIENFRTGEVMSVEITVQGFDELNAWLDSLQSGIDDAINEKMREIVADGAEQARAAAPVRTGRLRSSIGWAPAYGLPGAFVIFCDVSYAAYQEFGTRRMPARLFMTRAWETIMARWVELADAVSEALRS